MVMPMMVIIIMMIILVIMMTMIILVINHYQAGAVARLRLEHEDGDDDVVNDDLYAHLNGARLGFDIHQNDKAKECFPDWRHGSQ